MRNELASILDSIYTMLQKSSDNIFPEFQFRKIGNGWEATAGEWNGESAKGHVYHYDNTPFCLKNHKTGEAVSLWEYVQGTTGFNNRETLQELAIRAGYELPKLSDSFSTTIHQREQQASVLERMMDFFHKQLLQEQGREVLEYLLETRKYSTEEVIGMELGFLPSKDRIVEIFDQNGEYDVLSQTGILTSGFGSTHQLLIPYRNPHGRLKGFIARTILPEIKPKYKFSAGTEKDSFFLLNKARGLEELILVEGFLDALIASQRGIPGVVGIGGTSITVNQIDNIVSLGIKRITLALDNDIAGQDATIKAIDLLQEKELTVFVTQFDGKYKDPDEYIREKGREAFKQALHHAEKASVWKAHQLIGKYNITNAREQELLTEEALEWYSSLPSSFARDRKDFLHTISQSIGSTSEELLQKQEIIARRKGIIELEKAYRNFFAHGQRLLNERNFKEVESLLRDSSALSRSGTVVRNLQPYTFEHLQKDVRSTSEGLGTGYANLDKFITLHPETVTLIAGRPSHGKTTVLLNIFLNMVQNYPERHFFYFSYEETRKQLALKLVNILGGYTIDEKQNLRQLEYYLRGENDTLESIRQAGVTFDALAQSERLFLIDEPLPVAELIQTIAGITSQYKVGAIFIDYIQKIKTSAKFGTRQLELQNISGRILDAAKSFSVPIILGAQLGRDSMRKEKVRLDNLREAGDLEQDANVVLGIYNPSMERAQEEGVRVSERTVDINLSILKNRNGVVNESIDLEFDRPILRIREKSKPSDLNTRWSE